MLHHRPLLVTLAVALLGAVAAPQAASARGTTDLLDEANVRLDGVRAADLAGSAVAGVGDVNGDGRPDLAVGAPAAFVSTGSRPGAGAVYVVFGSAGDRRIQLSSIGASGNRDGFRIDGAVARDRAGTSVAGVGDLNGDGRAEIVVGAPDADPNGLSGAGSAYVVFGRAPTTNAETVVDLATLTTGFRIDGAVAGDRSGAAVAGVGDLTGSPTPDIAVGVPGADPFGRGAAGSVVVVSGRATTAPVPLATITAAGGPDGLRIDGAAAGDQAGSSVAAAGDVNADGRSDLILGAPLSSPGGRVQAGSAYVIFGRAATAGIDLDAFGAGGFRIDGGLTLDEAGRSVAGALSGADAVGQIAGTGDVNGDEYADVVVGAPLADPGSRTSAGSAYVVFGRPGTAPVALGALGGTDPTGRRYDGAAAGDRAGLSVAGAGLLDDDARAEVVVGAPGFDERRTNAGAAYVLTGGADAFVGDLGLIEGTPASGFRVDGATAQDETGSAVAGAGDLNGDGLGDLALGAPQADPNARSASGSAFVTFGRTADLSVSLSAAPAQLTTTETVTATVTARNAGPDPAVDVSVRDALPTGTEVASLPAQCTESDRVVTCELGDLGSGEETTVAIVLRATAPNAELANTVTVSSPTSDPDLEDRTDTATVRVDPLADLSVALADGPDPVASGEELTYTLAAVNQGPQPADAVTLRLTLALGVALVSAPEDCTLAERVVTCLVGDVPIGATTRDIVVRPATADPALPVSFSAESATADVDLADRSGSTTTTVTPVADLSLTLTDAPDPVQNGALLTLTPTARNDGPDPAVDAALRYELPTGTTFVEAEDCSEEDGVVLCPLGTLPSGGEATRALVVRTTAAAAALTSTATVSSPTADPDAADRSATVTTVVAPTANLSATLTDAPDPVLNGQPLTLTAGVSNAGPDAALGTALTFPLPDGLDVDSLPEGCSEDGSTVLCAVGTVEADGTEQVSIVVRPNQADPALLTTVTATTTTGPADAGASAGGTTEVVPAADVSLALTRTPGQLTTTETITYTLTASNAGPDPAQDLTLRDALPAGVRFVEASGSCVEAEGVVTCAEGELAAGAEVVETITVVATTPDPALANTATVTSTTADPDVADRSDTVTVRIDPLADLSASISAPTVSSGQDLTYTLGAANAGPQTAADVGLRFTLPTDTTFVSAGEDCERVERVVTCSLGDLAADTTATASVVVVPETADPALTATVVASSPTADSDLEDRTASTTTTVSPVAALGTTLSAPAGPVLNGQPLSYRATVTNGGPDTAAAVELVDALPAGLSVATLAAGCVETARTVRCALGDLAPGVTVVRAIGLRPTRPDAALRNEIVVTSETTGPAGSRSARATTEVIAAADLEVALTSEPATPRVGEPLTFTARVRNEGPDPAERTSLRVTLPAPPAPEALPDGCTVADLVVTCAIARVASGGEQRRALLITPGTPARVRAEARVSSATADPDDADNVAETTAEVAPRPVVAPPPDPPAPTPPAPTPPAPVPSRTQSALLRGGAIGPFAVRQGRRDLRERVGPSAASGAFVDAFRAVGGGTILLSYDRSQRVRVLMSTSPRTRIGRIAPGASTKQLRRSFGKLRATGVPGVRRVVSRGRTYLVVFRSGRVTHIGTGDAFVLATRRAALLRTHLRRFGIPG